MLCVRHERLLVRLWEGRAEGEPLLGAFHCIPLAKKHLETLTYFIRAPETGMAWARGTSLSSFLLEEAHRRTG